MKKLLTTIAFAAALLHSGCGQPDQALPAPDAGSLFGPVGPGPRTGFGGPIAPQGGTTTGTMTVNSIPIAVGPHTLGNSPLVYDGSEIISTLKSFSVGNVLGTTAGVELAPQGPLIHDYNPWGGGPHSSRVEIDLTNVTLGNLTVDGIVAGHDGDLLFLWNGGGAPVNPGTLTIPNATASGSSALNQIWLASGKELRLGNNEGVVLEYIGSFGWIALGGGHTEERAKQLSLEPACIAASVAAGTTQNNYNPFGACLDASGNSAGVTSYVRQPASGSGTVTYTGITAAGAPNSEGRELVFQNTSTSVDYVFTNADGASSGPNQILTPTGGSITVKPNQSVTFHYDLTGQWWRVDAYTGNSGLATISGLTTNQTLKAGSSTTVVNAWPVDDATAWGVPSKFTITEANGNFHGFGTGTIDGATSIAGALTLSNTVQATERIRFTGQEYLAAAHTDTNGPALLLMVNRTSDRRIALVDSANEALGSTAPQLQFGIDASAAYIDSGSTDAGTAKTLNINTRITSPVVIGGATTMNSTLTVTGLSTLNGGADVGGAATGVIGAGSGHNCGGCGASATLTLYSVTTGATTLLNTGNFDISFGNRNASQLLIEGGSGVTSMLGQGLAVGGLYEGQVQDIADLFQSGHTRTNWAKYTDVVANAGWLSQTQATTGNDLGWGTGASGNTLVFASPATTTMSSPQSYLFGANRHSYTPGDGSVGQLTCTSGGTACSAGGADWRSVMTSNSTGYTDLRSTSVTFSVYVRATSGTVTPQIALARYNDNEQTYTSCGSVGSSGWTRCTATKTFSSSSYTDNSELRVYIQPLSTTALYISDAQVQVGTVTTPYEPVETNNGDGSWLYVGYGSVSPPSRTGGGASNGSRAADTWVYSFGVGGTHEDPLFAVGWDGTVFATGGVYTPGSAIVGGNTTAGGWTMSSGTPSANHGTLATGSTNYAGKITSIGSNTTVVLTYSAAFANSSICPSVIPNSTSTLESIYPTSTSASSVTFSCYAILTGVASNCDDFTYTCLGR